MNPSNKTSLVFSLVLTIALQLTTYSQTNTSHYTLKEVWSTSQDLEAPESVIYNDATGEIYVSNISGKPLEANGHGFISKLSKDGKIEELKWITGLNAPKGMSINGNSLYVSDINTLVEIDIKNSKIVNSYPVKDAIFFNDVATDNKGNVYVSDSHTNKVHWLKNGKLETWLGDDVLKGPNGLYTTKDYLWVGCQDFLLKVNLTNKKHEVYAKGTSDIDGLELVDKNVFLFSNWVGRIKLIDENKKIIDLIDSSKEEIQTADIDYISETKTVLVPTFFDNRVIAYKLTRIDR